MIYKKIYFEDLLPISTEIIKAKSMNECWQNELLIGYIINGEITLKTSLINKTFKKNDAIIINSNEVYSIIPKSEEMELYIIYLNIDYLNNYFDNIKNLFFSISENLDKQTKVYDYIKKISFLIFSMFKNSSKNYKVNLLRSTIDLFEFLLENCQSTIVYQPINNANKNKIIKIVEYIDSSFSNSINLQDLSDKFKLNPQYISRFFKEKMGIGFQEYLNNMRLEKSLSDLIYSEKHIFDIALDYGFSDGKSYSRAFKKRNEITPLEFRKKNSNLLLLNKKNKFSEDKISTATYTIPTVVNTDLLIDSNNQEKIENHINNIINIGKAYEILLADVQFQIIQIQKELKYKYIRFTGIFNEEMNVCKESKRGEIFYNWNYIDKLIDFLLSNNLKPFINFGKSFYLNKNLKFNIKKNIDLPKSNDKWIHLIKNFFSHLIERYGVSEIQNWYFEAWNNPDLTIDNENRQKYFEFLKNTINTIKNISQDIKVGGPSLNSFTKRKDYYLWVKDFNNFMNTNTYKIDFFSIHLYRYELDKDNNLNYINHYKNVENVKSLYKDLKNNFNDKVKFIVTEWNPGKIYGNYSQDTCYMATNIVYFYINTIGCFENFAYSNISDINEDYDFGKDIFHGGYGLFTINSLKKASFNTFSLINKLGNQLIDKGNEWIITKQNNNKLQVLLCNYTEYNQNNFNNLVENLSFYNRYDVFEKEIVKNFKISISGLEKGTYYIKRTRLNKNSGSVLDAWLKMGAPENINNDIFNILKSKENMDFYIKKEEIENTIEIDEGVIGHGITLFEIEKKI